jgi:hypothetical protein
LTFESHNTANEEEEFCHCEVTEMTEILSSKGGLPKRALEGETFRHTIKRQHHDSPPWNKEA